jgi:glycosyltransferase involved in cell wall biosynthesis
MNVLIPHGFEANYSIGFARGLTSNGMTLVVLSNDETEDRLSAAGIRNVNIGGRQSENRSVLEKLLNMLRYYWKLLLFVFRNRGATIHFSGNFRDEFILFEGVILNLSFRLLASRYIYTTHNILPHNRESSLFFRWTYRFVYSVPHFIVVHTQKTRQVLIERFGVPSAKIRVMSIGLNEEVPATVLGRQESRARFGFDGTAKVILFFGRIAEYKGLDHLIEAFDRLELPEIHLIIAGPFRGAAYRKRILAAIAGARRRADILLDARLIPNEEVAVFFSASDVLCLPYRNIYQSGPLFLAMRFGKPVVATNVGSFSEFVTRDTGLITKTNDVPGIADALRDFFASSGRFRSERILAEGERYRWGRVCQVLLPLYEAGNGSRSAPP